MAQVMQKRKGEAEPRAAVKLGEHGRVLPTGAVLEDEEKEDESE